MSAEKFEALMALILRICLVMRGDLEGLVCIGTMKLDRTAR